MTESQEQRKRDWLAKVAAHPETTEADYAAAEATLRDDPPTAERVDISNLVRLGFLSTEQEWVATLRCQTWNVWPEKSGAEQRIRIQLEGSADLRARLIVISYAQRSYPERYVQEETTLGPLLWDGEAPGLRRVREIVLKDPEDVIEVRQNHRHAYRGEVDICINFKFEGDPPGQVIEALRTVAHATMSLLNLKLDDYLTPAAPFQLRKVFRGGASEFTTTTALAVKSRQTIEQGTLEETLSEMADVHRGSKYGKKLTIALELYAAHFTEQQVRVRFILLVIAMEALAEASDKDQVALDLLDRWCTELEDEKTKHDTKQDPPTAAFRSLNSLSGQLNRLREESIGVQIGNLFADPSGVGAEEIKKLKKRAKDLYNKRSTLVHEGYVPAEELPGLEQEARELLEMLFASAIDRE